MTCPAFGRLPGLILLLTALAALVLGACGGGKTDGTPPATLLRVEDLATQAAQQTAAALPPSPFPPTAGATAALPDSPTPSPTLTDAPTVTPAPPISPTATLLAPEQIEATGIALTNTAIVQVMPITQTYDAIIQITQSAAALVTLTPTSEAPSFTPPVTPTPTNPPPSGPYQIVFYTNRYGHDDLYLMTLNGEERALTTALSNEREPSCSPDGRMVVYASDASGSYQIYLLRLDRTEPVQLTDSAGLNFAPMFSPDGSTIAFVSTRDQGIPMIWLMDADGGNPRPLTSELGRDTSPNWGPDGRQLLFAGDQDGTWDLFITIVGEVEGEFPVMPPEFGTGNEIWPQFDPTGERIAYSTWANLDDPQTADLYLLDFEQPEPVALRAGPGADIAWGWADDTHLLASVGGPDDVQIALIDVTTGETVRLTDTGPFNGGARLCVVSPDILPPEPTRVPSPTPTPTLTPSPTKTVAPTVTPSPTRTPAPFTATPSPTPGPSSTPAASTNAIPPALLAVQGRGHIVQPGENLVAISAAYGVNMTTLIALNGLSNPDRLSVGQRLTIPVTRIAPRQGGYQVPDPDRPAAPPPHKMILVRVGQQRVYAYENGQLKRTMIVSTGVPEFPTVQGRFKIYQKLPSQTMIGPGYRLPGVPYVMYFYQGYGLHGTYWHHNFGQPMSHGCVNLPTIEAKWLYGWAEIGTEVIVKP